jgi:hypothetical protein
MTTFLGNSLKGPARRNRCFGAPLLRQCRLERRNVLHEQADARLEDDLRVVVWAGTPISNTTNAGLSWCDSLIEGSNLRAATPAVNGRRVGATGRLRAIADFARGCAVG